MSIALILNQGVHFEWVGITVMSILLGTFFSDFHLSIDETDQDTLDEFVLKYASF